MSAVTAFVPCRKSSERVLRKNIRPFGPYQHGLLELKLTQLLSCSCIESIVLSTNDEEIITFAQDLGRDRLLVHRRDDSLSANDTSTDSLVPLVIELVGEAHIMWTHVTSPFVSADVYSSIVHAYFNALSNGFDSLMTTTPLRGFVWSNDKPVNYDRTIEKWPRTQTLQLLHEVNSAAFLASSDVYAYHQDRIGLRPCLYPLNRVTGIDIDWEDDFVFAEQLLANGMAGV